MAQSKRCTQPQSKVSTIAPCLGILLLVASELRLVLDEASLELAGEDAEVLVRPERLEQRREIFHELTLHAMPCHAMVHVHGARNRQLTSPYNSVRDEGCGVDMTWYDMV